MLTFYSVTNSDMYAKGEIQILRAVQVEINGDDDLGEVDIVIGIYFKRNMIMLYRV